MCYYVVKSNGTFVARSTVIPVPEHELNSEEMQKQTAEFTTKLHSAIGDNDKAIVHNDEQLDGTDLYNSCFYNDTQDDSTTYPWDDDWKDVALQDETE